MAISEEEIAQVRAATDIVALITEHVALKKSGRRWSGLCPFHGEKTPSFSVNAEEGRYYCFGCRASGDQITFVREMMHLDFIDAVRVLAERAGIELHEDERGGSQRKEKAEFMTAMDHAVSWYHDRLLTSPDARDAREYLRSRGINGDIARQFKLGWAPDEWDALCNALKLTPKVLEGTGLGFVNKRDRKQDALRSRVIFPIFDASGKAIAVGGRILPGVNATRPDGYVEPKYKNSPETAIYSKRRTLYALNWAKDNIIKTGEIIVCEGYTDVIACFMAEMPRAVATCGTALGEEHFRVMKNFAKRIVLAYDADSAGQSAAASVYQWEKSHDVDVAVARLPKGSDPAELAQKDPAALRAAIANAVPFLQFRLERVLDGANLATAEGRARAAESALHVLVEHPSDLVRDQYLVTVADRLRLDIATLRPRLLALTGAVGRPGPTATPPAGRSGGERLPRPGQEALRLELFFPEAVRDRLVAPYFVHPTQRQVFNALRRGGPVSEAIDELERMEALDAAALLSELSVTELDREYTVDDVTAVVSQLLRAAVTEAFKELERQLRAGETEPASAMATIRDVKARLELLAGPQAGEAELDLRTWLLDWSNRE